MLNRKSNFKTSVAQDISLVSHKIPNMKLIFKNGRIKACFDALEYNLLSFKNISPFLMSAQSGFTRSHNALANKNSSDRTSYYIDGLMHSIFAENFNLAQVKDSRTQIHTLHYYIAENIACLNTLGGVYAIFLLCWGIRCLVTLLSYTQH